MCRFKNKTRYSPRFRLLADTKILKSHHASIDAVITSYSIHYTKLYDVRVVDTGPAAAIGIALRRLEYGGDGVAAWSQACGRLDRELDRRSLPGAFQSYVHCRGLDAPAVGRFQLV